MGNWRDPAGSSIGGSFSGGTNNSVPFINPAGTWAQDNPNFTYTLGTTTLAVPNIGISGSLTDTNNDGFKLLSGSGLLLGNTNFIGFSSTASQGGARDASIIRDGIGFVAFRSVATAQGIRIYNSFTDASNYERGRAAWASNFFFVGTEAAGTGTLRNVAIGPSGAGAALYLRQDTTQSIGWQLQGSAGVTGAIVPEVNNTNDIGTSTFTIRNFYLNGNAGGNAAAGAIGEYVSSTIAQGAAVGLTTATSANMTSISLTAGDWEVSGVIAFQFGATTSYTNLVGGVSSVSATLPAQEITFDLEQPATIPTAGKDMSFVMPTTRISIASTTNIFAVAQGTFTASTLKAYGILRARRVR